MTTLRKVLLGLVVLSGTVTLTTAPASAEFKPWGISCPPHNASGGLDAPGNEDAQRCVSGYLKSSGCKRYANNPETGWTACV